MSRHKGRILLEPLKRTASRCFAASIGAGVVLAWSAALAGASEPWTRHTIDNSSRGADGVRLGDLNQDGRLDIVTGWEEGGMTRLYLNPGPLAARRPWPQATAGRVASPEDAVFIDLNGDGFLDVVTSCEGNNKTLYVHWAPANRDALLEPAAWKTEPIPASRKEAWMFVLPRSGSGPSSFFAGSKGENGSISLFQPGANGRSAADWKTRRLRDSGWIMSLIGHDLDGDGDEDLLFSDRKGKRSGVGWLENPGAGRGDAPWREHRIGASGREVMFIDLVSLGETLEVVAAVKPAELLMFKIRRGRAVLSDGEPWETRRVPFPAGTGRAKAVRSVDLDRDGRRDLLVSCEGGGGKNSGVFWLRNRQDGGWDLRDISGPEGVKFDRIELADLDQDGDLDAITTEETSGLGVVWYENP